jgi:hypothetical protein
MVRSDVPGRAAHRARLSRVVTAALLSEVAEVGTLPDLRSEVPEDRVRNRDVEEEVGQHQVPDVVFAAGARAARQESSQAQTPWSVRVLGRARDSRPLRSVHAP